MPTDLEKQRIRKMAAEGKSVNHITELTGLPKSTVYYHFKKEVGQKQKEKQPEILEDQDFQGELCGIFAGDGGFQHDKNGGYRIRFFLNYNHEYWKLLSDYLERNLSSKPNVYTYPEKSKTVLNYTSKSLYLFLKDKLDWQENKTESINLRNSEGLCPDFNIGFLRGLIDTDGYRRKDHRRYVFSSASCGLINSASKILQDLRIEHTVFVEKDRRRMNFDKHKIRTTGESVIKFEELINPRNPQRKYN